MHEIHENKTSQGRFSGDNLDLPAQWLSVLLGARLQWLPRLVLAAVFLAAGIPKILHPHEFALAVFRYQILPYGLVNLMAIYLPWLEMVAVAALLWPRGRFRDAGVALIAGMLVMFTVAIAFNLWRGVDVSCGCFSVNPETGRIGALSLVRNFALLGLCLWVWAFEWWRPGRAVLLRDLK